jgi:hypothetical protein
MNLTNKPIRVSRIPSRTLDGRAVIIQPQRQVVHELNPVATYLWNALGDSSENAKSVQELVTEVLENFDVEQEQATADALEFLSSIQELGLVQLTE